MTRPILILCLIACAPVAAPTPLSAQPAPITGAQFDFPGDVPGPATAASAGVGLADRWIGDTPFDNPATPEGRVVDVSGLLMRISRQDLRAENRQYDEKFAFIDGAGASAGMPLGGLQWSVYVHQPVLRLEDYAFVAGRLATAGPSAIIQGNASEREVRAGLAVSAPVGPLRAGMAGDWTHRSDSYDIREQSGSPDAGTRHADFSGGAVGGQVGVRYERGSGAPGTVTAGASLRWLPAIDLDGNQELQLAGGDSTASLGGKRESGWEAGLSARVVVAPAIRIIAGGGARTARAWQGFGVTTGRGFEWAVGADYHDAGEAWSARLGVGQSQTQGVPEPRASVVGIGFGWLFGESSLDVAMLRRGLGRPGEPTSFDYRLVVSYTAHF